MVSCGVFGPQSMKRVTSGSAAYAWIAGRSDSLNSRNTRRGVTSSIERSSLDRGRASDHRADQRDRNRGAAGSPDVVLLVGPGVDGVLVGAELDDPWLIQVVGGVPVQLGDPRSDDAVVHDAG